MATYSEKLKRPSWQKLRLEVFKRDKWTCKKCKDKETTLNVHHLAYAENPEDVSKDKLITLCEDCHLEVEALKKADGGMTPFWEIKIVKINITDTGKRIMFVRSTQWVSVIIYNAFKEKMVGFNFDRGDFHEMAIKMR